MDESEKVIQQPNPQESASIFSLATFGYVLPTFTKGFRKDLEEEDIPKCLDVHTSKSLGDKLEKAWKKELTLQNPSLWRAVRTVFGLEFILLGLVCLFNQLVLNMSQPLALSQLMKYYTKAEPGISKNEALLYAGIIVGAAFLKVLVEHNYILSLYHFGMKLRVACCSLIYRKSLRLSKEVFGKTTVGQMVNLLSNDVSRCDLAIVNAQIIWVCPIQTLVVMIILCNITNVTSILGIVLMVGCVPFQMYLAKKTSKFRLKTAFKTDQRIRTMNEVISGIQLIKMYAWEKPFSKLIGLIRRLEIRNIQTKAYIKGILIVFTGFITRFTLFLTILTYVLIGYTLDAEYVFVVISFYNIIKQVMTKQFSRGLIQLEEVNVSILRIQTFLLHKESGIESKQSSNTNGEAQGSGPQYQHTFKIDDVPAKVQLQNASAKWSVKSTSNTLDEISFIAEEGELVAVIGSVGSGKSSLFYAILNELPLISGTLNITGTISYASQEPWVFAGSLQKNILFGQSMDVQRYREVIRVCALEKDLPLLPSGYKTQVGEGGMKLSGGQRARISLARAIYKEADIYLFDDPLSAVDAQVGKQLFEECICKFLANKCVILITHQVQYIQRVDRVYLIENGKIKASGLDSAKQLLGNEVDAAPTSPVINNIACRNSILEDNEEPTEEKEHRSCGSISKDVYFLYFKSGGSLLMALAVLIMFILTQITSSGSDYFLTYWVNMEQTRTEQPSTNSSKTHLPNLTPETCIYYYAGLVLAMTILTLTATFSFYNYAMEASRRLHDKMFFTLIHLPMQFFQSNPCGRILNRFTRDLGSIDEILPGEVFACIEMVIHVTGVTFLVCLVKPWILLVTLVMLIVFYLLRIVYLRTSRSVRRLDAITRSPIFGHLSASMQGLTTIRAYGVQDILEMEFDDLQDIHSSVYYLSLTSSRAFGFWLDMICVLYIASVTFSFFISKSEEYGGNVGLAITQAMTLTGKFQIGMRHWSELENQMTSVERVMEYTELECEPERKKIIPSSFWPETGFIKFLAVSMRYSAADPNVLKQVTFQVEPREKIGIVGRTGAGKSSLIYALFQLAKTEGTIIIDNIDISQVPLQSLRSKITIIPQDPVLFSGSLRNNLDPFGEYSDEELSKVLDNVDLFKLVAGRLNIRIAEGGSNLSAGQKQLICLARAIVRKNKIVVLDEATASIDPQTDVLIQAIIRTKCADCTVLTVAHRLQTIMDSDKVLVMEVGNVIEFDHPHLLLQKKDSQLYAMVQQTGEAIARSLSSAAELSYNNKVLKKMT